MTIFDNVKSPPRGHMVALCFRFLGFVFKILGPSFKRRVLSSRYFFDETWYLAHYNDVRKNGLDPLHHYRHHGFEEGRSPNGWAGASLGVSRRETSSLDDIRLADHMKVVGESGLFDEPWYALFYGVDRANALQHFLTAGVADQTDPNMFFSTSRYFQENPDVAQAGWNALVHYIEVGFHERRTGHINPRFAHRGDLGENEWRVGLGARC